MTIAPRAVRNNDAAARTNRKMLVRLVRQHGRPFRQRQLLDRLANAETGVADQRIEAALGRPNAVDQCRDRRFVRNVADHRAADRCRIAIGNDHVPTVVPQSRGDRRTNPTRTAGDQSDRHQCSIACRCAASRSGIFSGSPRAPTALGCNAERLARTPRQPRYAPDRRRHRHGGSNQDKASLRQANAGSRSGAK